MSNRCRCRYCGRFTDCQSDICELCEIDHEGETNQCMDGHCDIQLEEVKPGIYKFQKPDDLFYLRRIDV